MKEGKARQEHFHLSLGRLQTSAIAQVFFKDDLKALPPLLLLPPEAQITGGSTTTTKGSRISPRKCLSAIRRKFTQTERNLLDGKNAGEIAHPCLANGQGRTMIAADRKTL